jgi:hypothetical protein
MPQDPLPLPTNREPITHPIARQYIEAGKKGLAKARAALAEAQQRNPVNNPWSKED